MGLSVKDDFFFFDKSNLRLSLNRDPSELRSAFHRVGDGFLLGAEFTEVAFLDALLGGFRTFLRLDDDYVSHFVSPLACFHYKG